MSEKAASSCVLPIATRLSPMRLRRAIAASDFGFRVVIAGLFIDAANTTLFKLAWI